MKVLRRFGTTVVVMLGVLAARPTAAQMLHGASIQKACVGPVLVDPTGVGKARVGDPITCTIRVSNRDDFGDAIRVDSITDTTNHVSGNTTTANLLAMPVVLPTPGTFIEVSHGEMVLADDVDPLTDKASALGRDLGVEMNFMLMIGATVRVVPCAVDGDCEDDNPCTIDTCVIDTLTNTCSNQPVAVQDQVVCRSSAGVCDPAELCDGTATCPADAKSPSGTVCRSALGVCDVAEMCDGVSDTCPAQGFAPSGTVCRSSAGVCDVAESCPGTGPDCPADDFLPSSMVCRTAAGVCDAAESCPGTGPACPATSSRRREPSAARRRACATSPRCATARATPARRTSSSRRA